MLPSSRQFALLSGLVLVFALVLRVLGLDSQVLWLDEGYSWWDAHQSLGDIWRLIPQCDPHPPLYMFILKGWMDLFGDSSLALRSLSTLIGVLTTGMVILAGRELNPRLALVAGVIFASMPFQIEFAQEARPYTLVALGAAILAFGVLRSLALLRPEADGALPSLRSRRAWAAWVAIVVGLDIMLWSNNTSPFMAAALGGFACGMAFLKPAARRLIVPMIGCGVAVVLLWLPYVPTLLEQARSVTADFWVPRPDAWRFGNELRFVVGLGSFVILWLIGGLWALGLWRLRREPGQALAAVALLVLVVAPVVLNFVVSRIATPVYLARALIGIAPFFALGLAAVFSPLADCKVNWRWSLPALAALVVAQISFAMPLYTRPHRKEPWDLVAQDLLQSIRDAGVTPENAVVLVTPNELALPLSHVLSHCYHVDLETHGLPGDFPQPGLVARYPSGKCAPSVIDQTLSRIPGLIGSRRTVFLVTRDHNVYDPKEEVPAVLHGLGLKSVDRHDFFPGSLLVYEYSSIPARLAGSLGKVIRAPGR